MRGINTATAALISFIIFLFTLIARADSMGPEFNPSSVAPPPPKSYGPFVMEPKLEPRVKFWVDIYAKYHSWETVIHDPVYPQVVYSVVDTKARGKNAINAEKAHVVAVLKGLLPKVQLIRDGKLSKYKLKDYERKIYEAVESAGMLDKIRDFADMKRMRGQAGLRDNLIESLFISGRYIPRMERVFERFNLPSEIAYLPFVESGFNKRAVSKVGASGIWQFMPYTGKLYLRVDAEVDERNDPMRAAEAAARLMKQNFEILGEWPLAVTAYNHGAMGVARGAKEVGSKSLADIIEKFDNKNFGFASQNFYSCFLAALHVGKNSESYLGAIPRARKLEFDEFVMPHYMELKVFLEKLGIDEADFHELNPALTQEVYSGRKFIPVGYIVRVPVDARGEFLSRYESIPAFLKHATQRGAENITAPANALVAGPADSAASSGQKSQ